ncbi:MAG: 1-acyl-sn-glycerol-3-phosphate acyltransferase [Lachnospiraceae bacterium]|nr:1-acyl-sn-glycerol-3-phosphate acyltransferase [Lachnospiraceae bacterium]
MLRLFYICLVSLPFILYYLWKVGYVERHGWRYSEAKRYRIARRMITIMKHNGLIHTNVYGEDTLPEEGGYVMYANHQGKYDSLGIIGAHKKPCTVLMDEKRSHLFLADQFVTLLKGTRLDKSSMKAQLNTILNVISEVKDGRRYIIFPEGGYEHNQNNVQEFMPGAFKCAMKAKSPIVPVALIDSYKPFGMNSLKPVTTQVHFLKPLYYEDYKDLSTREVSDLVRKQIISTIEQITCA